VVLLSVPSRPYRRRGDAGRLPLASSRYPRAGEFIHDPSEPITDAGGDVVADLEHDERNAALVEVGGGGKADRSGSDHGDGKCGGFMGVSPRNHELLPVEMHPVWVGCFSRNVASVAGDERLHDHGDDDDAGPQHRSST
jgi:hypothetical protein